MGTRRYQNVPQATGQNTKQVLDALVDSVTYITAQTQPKITFLGTNPTNAEIAAKINEILARLQGGVG